MNLKVRFRTPEQEDATRDAGIRLHMAPARRPQVPRWRWYALMALVALPFLWLTGQVLGAWLVMGGRGLLGYPALELRAPVNGQVEAVLVQEGQAVPAGRALLRLRNLDLETAAALQGVALGPAAASLHELSLAAPLAATVERLPVQIGEFVSRGQLLLVLRTGEQPQVQAWLDSRYRRRLYPGRPVSVLLPDGSRRMARISQIGLQAEAVPEALRPVSGEEGEEGESRLRVALRLEPPPMEGPPVSRLPVEVRLHWRDEPALQAWWQRLGGTQGPGRR